jgi:hypothetical protein
MNHEHAVFSRCGCTGDGVAQPGERFVSGESVQIDGLLWPNLAGA